MNGPVAAFHDGATAESWVSEVTYAQRGWEVCRLCGRSVLLKAGSVVVEARSGSQHFHEGCIYPQVIVAAESGLYVGRLTDLTLGVDAYWIALSPTVQAFPRGHVGWMHSVSMPLPRVARVVLRSER